MDLTHPNFSDRKPPVNIKVCGMRKAENVKAVAALSIDMMGFIFYENSPRNVDLEDSDLKMTLEHLEIERVGVFVNAEIPFVLEKVGSYHLDFVQLHGEESPEYCHDLKGIWPSIKFIKAFSVDESFDFSITKDYEGLCELFVFDTKGENRGGNGVAFDWSLLNNYTGETPFLLSGGIGLENVEAVSEVYFPKMIGLDLNSKFETAPGLKDVEKLNAFISKIKSND